MNETNVIDVIPNLRSHELSDILSGKHNTEEIKGSQNQIYLLTASNIFVRQNKENFREDYYKVNKKTPPTKILPKLFPTMEYVSFQESRVDQLSRHIIRTKSNEEAVAFLEVTEYIQSKTQLRTEDNNGHMSRMAKEIINRYEIGAGPLITAHFSEFYFRTIKGKKYVLHYSGRGIKETTVKEAKDIRGNKEGAFTIVRESELVTAL